MPVESAFAVLPGRRREVFDAIVRHQGASIYDIAKTAQVPYRRTHAHVVALINQGLVRKRIDENGPRRIARLYTLH
jgi:predicted transcriptional regulator